MRVGAGGLQRFCTPGAIPGLALSACSVLLTARPHPGPATAGTFPAPSSLQPQDQAAPVVLLGRARAGGLQRFSVPGVTPWLALGAARSQPHPALAPGPAACGTFLHPHLCVPRTRLHRLCCWEQPTSGTAGRQQLTGPDVCTSAAAPALAPPAGSGAQHAGGASGESWTSGGLWA